MSSKDVGIRIRVEKELREAFQGACMSENRQVSDVLREFMRAFADRNNGGKQSSLFAAPPAEEEVKVAATKKRSTNTKTT
ncbi:hypothetical protein SAMN05444172_0019 [Burkholderia sp. GAS332]|nr:hypothetical protein SAMN05444172_0019 [Burkholderia sp. GAS332]